MQDSLQIKESNQAAEAAVDPVQENYMREVLLKEKGVIDIDSVPIPKPKHGEVLIKVECAIINPYDLQFMSGLYKGDYEFPLVAGSEGSGTVIASGGGLYAWSMLGKRVTFTKNFEVEGKYTQHGAFAEYICTNAWNCIPLANDMTFEKGAGGVVLPLTIVGLLERCQALKAKAVIISAANSQVGNAMAIALKE